MAYKVVYFKKENRFATMALNWQRIRPYKSKASLRTVTTMTTARTVNTAQPVRSMHQAQGADFAKGLS